MRALPERVHRGARTIALLLLAAAAAPAAEPKPLFPVARTEPEQKRLIQMTSYLMGLSESDMLAIVPEQSGIYFTDCPNCDGGTQDRAPWEWKPEQPRQIRCTHCGETYPGNPKYPDTESITVTGPAGEHRYPYYQRADGYRIFLRAHADYLAADYMAKQCRALAELYAASGDEKAARRAALILDRFARVYPGYASKVDLPFRPKEFAPATEQRIKGAAEYRTSRWTWWAYMGISGDMLRAYDALRFWPGLAALDSGKALRRIREDLFGGMVRFVMAFNETYSNMSPGMWRDFIVAGRLLDRPEWVQEAVTRLDAFLTTQFLYDGMWMEPSTGYGAQVAGNTLSVVQQLEGYEPPRTSAKAFAETVRRSRSVLTALDRVLSLARLPTGAELPVNDAWARHKKAPPASNTTLLFPGFGVALLRGGESSDAVCAWLNFTAGTGHKHRDALSIGLFARDRELLPDIGYTHTRWRGWTIASAAHNTVIVNGLSCAPDPDITKTRLRTFAGDGKAFHLVEAENSAAYAGLASRYRRACALIGADARDAYLLDIFQVHGGAQHDYLLHGSADAPSVAAVAEAAFAPFDGSLLNPDAKFAWPKGEGDMPSLAGGYGYVRHLSRAPAPPTVTLDLRLREPPSAGSRTLLLCEPNTTLFLGEGPQVRPAAEKDDQLDKHWAPFFCARREGADLKSTFIAAHIPVSGDPRPLKLAAQRQENGLLIIVERGTSARDYFVMALEPDAPLAFATPDGALSSDARYAVLRVENGQVRAAHCVDGRRLALARFSLKGAPGWDGIVLKASSLADADARGQFEVAEQIPADAAIGALLVEFGDGTSRAYNVVRIARAGIRTRLTLLEDPGFVVAGNEVRLTSWPQRVIPSAKVAYHLIGVAHGGMAAAGK